MGNFESEWDSVGCGNGSDYMFARDQEQKRLKKKREKKWAKEWDEAHGYNDPNAETGCFPLVCCLIFDLGSCMIRKIRGRSSPAETSYKSETECASSQQAKVINIEVNNCVSGIMYEQMLTTSLRLEVNKEYITTVEQYRSVTLPHNIVPGTSLNLQLPLNKPNGVRIEEADAAFFKVNYDQHGKIIKLSLPNFPLVASIPHYPVLTMYHGELYTLPVSSGHYNDLTHIVEANHGVIEIGCTEPAYSLNCLST